MTDRSVVLEFHIREFEPSDFDVLCAIDKMCFAEAIAYTPDEMEWGLSQPGAVVWVAEQGSRIVAFVLAALGGRRQGHGIGHIITIDVLEDSRRSGIGEALMTRSEESLRTMGASRIVLEVNVDNASAIRFYQKLGYAPIRRLPKYYADDSDAYRMEKRLPLSPPLSLGTR